MWRVCDVEDRLWRGHHGAPFAVELAGPLHAELLPRRTCRSSRLQNLHGLCTACRRAIPVQSAAILSHQQLSRAV